MATRGRPKGSKNKPKKKTITPQPKKTCTNCNQDRSLRDFYIASNPLTSNDGKRVNVCKECIKAASLNIDGTLNVEAFKKMLMLIDRPYAPDVLEAAIKEAANPQVGTRQNRTDVIGLYMKNISSLPQYSKLSFLESMNMLGEEVSIEQPKSTVLENRTRKKDTKKIYANEDEEFELTDEIIDRFGEGYTKTQYRKMQRKYDKLKQNYQLSTNLHEEALATYVRFKVREEEATANGDVASADKWNKSAADAAERAKLTPKQLTQADLQGGITAISEISKAVEEAADIIEILPRFKYAPNDAPDFIIWCYINFGRKLRGLPEVDYKDVYAFYDRKKEEYISQYGDPYGIFTDDTSEKNREAVKKFIKLPKDYGDDNGK